MDAAALVVSGHRYAEKIVRAGPLKFAGWLSFAAIIALLLPARFIGVHSLAGTNDDVGIWWQANWSLQFAVVLPAIFGGFVALAYWSYGALRTLCDAKRSVIVKSDGTLLMTITRTYHVCCALQRVGLLGPRYFWR